MAKLPALRPNTAVDKLKNTLAPVLQKIQLQSQKLALSIRTKITHILAQKKTEAALSPKKETPPRNDEIRERAKKGELRNIINTLEIESFLERMEQQARGHEDIQSWVRKNLRNYIYRIHGDIRTIDEPRAGDPPWALRDFAKKRPIHEVSLEHGFSWRAEHILDFFIANRNIRIDRMSVYDAFRAAGNWQRQLHSQKIDPEYVEGPDDVDTIAEYDDAYRWVRIKSQASYIREGRIMRHCV